MKRLQKFEAQATDGIDVRKVAAVEDFYDIIKAIHVDKRGSHAGQKRTYKIVSWNFPLFFCDNTLLVK